MTSHVLSAASWTETWLLLTEGELGLAHWPGQSISILDIGEPCMHADRQTGRQADK